MIKIIDDLLTVNPYSRTGKRVAEVKTIVLHWTAMPQQSTKDTRDYYEGLKLVKPADTAVYASAHYIVRDSEIRRCIPENEVAFHCGAAYPYKDGTTQVYTDIARQKLGKYCMSPLSNSPNNCSIGIEMSPIDSIGHYSYDTWHQSQLLVLTLLKQFSLKPIDIMYHSQIVGKIKKQCPKLFVEHEDEFNRFVSELATLKI